METSGITTTWAGMHGEGMQLELSFEVAGQSHYLGRFIADAADETLFIEFAASGQTIRIPVARLEALIAEARRDVHSEAWYDRPPAGGHDDK